MHCPYCKNEDTKVLDSRVADDGGSIRRRRSCSACDRRFLHGREDAAHGAQALRRHRAVQRDKAIAGVRKACKGRPVTDAQLACLGQDVEDALRLSGHEFRSTTSASRSSPRCERSTRSPTSASPPSTAPSTPSRPSGRDRDAAARARDGRLERDLSPRADHRRPGRWWGSRLPAYQAPARRLANRETTTTGDGMTETVSTGAKGAAKGKGLKLERVFSTKGTHPYDAVTWERRDVVQTNWKTGETVFEQRGVEYPDFWSVNASTIVTTKYSRRGRHRRPRVEPQAAHRPDREDVHQGRCRPRLLRLRRRRRDLRARADLAPGQPVLLLQLAGVVQRRHRVSPQQVSACFILSVDDSMDSILNWYKEEGFIFKGGSGAGLNLSRIRSSKSCCPPAVRPRAPSPSCAAPTRPRAPSSRRRHASRGPRWSSSTSTTPTSRSS